MSRWLTFSTLLAHREKESGGLLWLYLSRMFFTGDDNIIAGGETPLVDGVDLGGVAESSQRQADSRRCESRWSGGGPEEEGREGVSGRRKATSMRIGLEQETCRGTYVTSSKPKI
jgi:hypothetical protein